MGGQAPGWSADIVLAPLGGVNIALHEEKSG